MVLGHMHVYKIGATFPVVKTMSPLKKKLHHRRRGAAPVLVAPGVKNFSHRSAGNDIDLNRQKAKLSV